MHQAGAAVADRHAFLHVQGGSVRAGIFLRRLIDLSMTVPALAHHNQPHRGGPARTLRGGWNSCPAGTGGLSSHRRPSPRRHSGLLPTASGVGAWRGVRSEMALRGVPPAFRAYHSKCPGVVCRGGRRPIAGARNGMTHRFSCTRTTCRWCRFGRRARVSAPYIMVACAPAFLFPCPAEREFASGARAGLPEY